MKMKNVLIVFPFEMKNKPFSGGIFKATLNLIKFFEENNWNIDLYIPLKNKGIKDFLDSNEYKVNVLMENFDVPRRYKDSPFFIRIFESSASVLKFMKSSKKIEKVLNNNYNMIYFQEMLGIWFLKYVNNPKTKKVVHIHSYRFLESFIIRNIVKYKIDNYANLAISPTNSILEKLNLNKAKTFVVKTPYNSKNLISYDYKINQYFINKKNKLKFSYIGRINSIKRIDLFLKAMILLGKKYLNKVEFDIVGVPNTKGDRKYLNKLKSIIFYNKLENNVNFLGYIEDIERYLKEKVNFGVLLTKSEAISMAGLEFVFNNIPVIAFDVPGNNELLEDAKGGVLIHDGDIQALSENIKKIIDNENFSISLIKSCEERKKLFSYNKFSDEMKKILIEISGNKSSK
ncbi:hypothetical protein X275_11055 [Marinitoga sp. 1197]|uniref:glycosyltransferase family 4 protein n=1 Tax=Marinitoga sp. 1197 TaxID=1428449 RepID=UPI0006413A6E|nr:glycosyltransferase family 4 protein [Marinitoga sp. 1197]KLO20832.1 hypothetical protein X275_11055 [Marinitoga sp. 1197]